MCVGATKDISGLLEFTVSGTGERIGLFSIAVLPVHAKDFSDKVTLGNETRRMERTGQRPFQVERKAVLGCWLTMSKAHCGASEPTSGGPGRWWVFIFSQMHHSPFWNIRYGIKQVPLGMRGTGVLGGHSSGSIYISPKGGSHTGGICDHPSWLRCVYRKSPCQRFEFHLSKAPGHMRCHHIRRCGWRKPVHGGYHWHWKTGVMLTLKKSVCHKKITWTNTKKASRSFHW